MQRSVHRRQHRNDQATQEIERTIGFAHCWQRFAARLSKYAFTFRRNTRGLYRIAQTYTVDYFGLWKAKQTTHGWSRSFWITFFFLLLIIIFNNSVFWTKLPLNLFVRFIQRLVNVFNRCLFIYLFIDFCKKKKVNKDKYSVLDAK